MIKHNIGLFIRSSAICIVLASLIASPVYACTPVGTINKSVEDLTTGSALEDANTTSSALNVNSGDTLQYVITISNKGMLENNGNDDMTDTVLTDTLPAGIVLVNNPTQTTISDDIGTVPAGKSVTETYQVKVTSNRNGAYITNKACFTGNSVNNNDKQSGCDTAVVVVNVPTPTPTPTPVPTPPVTPPAPQPQPQPVTLPNTGPGNLIVPAVAASVLGYFGYMIRAKRRAARQS